MFRTMMILIVLLLCGFSAQAATVSVNSPQAANTVLVGPTSGGNDFPSFRLLTTNDFPSNIINGASIQNTTINLTTKVTGVLPLANGGTNGATKQAGFDNLSPTAAKGDLIVYNGTNNVAVNVGSNNQVLVADSTQAAGVKWAAAGTGTAFSGLTGGTNTAAAMVVGTGASLAPSGSGTITANAYNGTNNINASNALTSQVPVANGGTGADLSGTGGAHKVLFQATIGSAITVNTLAEADLPATTAFTDTTNTFTSTQNFSNYLCLQQNSPAQITADQPAFDPGNTSYCRVNTSASWNLQGIINGANGRYLNMINVGSSPLVIQHENGSATAANRIWTPTAAALTLTAGYGAQFIYDSVDSRWKLINIFQTGGGTGGVTVPTGTSGGIPYYSGTSAISSSALLTQHALVLGGGSGTAPYVLGSLGTTTTVLHGNAAGDPSYGQIATSDIAANAVDMSSKMTGTMQAAQMPALTGDVTNTAGSLTTTIANLAVTNAKIANSTIDLTAKVTGALPIANGGSGQTTQQAAIDALAGSAAKGSVFVNNGTHWVQLPVGADNTVLTASSGATNGVTWGGAGGATVVAPMTLNAGAVQLGTVVAGTNPDANSSITMGSAGTTKKVTVFQTVANNTAPAVEVQKSDGTVQWQIDNSTTSRADITEKLQTANQANIQMQSITETITIANATTTTTATNLIPANSYIVGVTARVVTASIATASTYSLGISGNTTLFTSSASTTLGQTMSTLKQTPPLAPFTNSSASTIVITPNLTPVGNTGQLRITVFYFTLQEPQN